MSGVNHPSERVEGSRGDGIGQRGMRMNGEVHFLDGVLVRPRDHELMDHLRGVRADDVRAEDLSVFRAANDLDEAVDLAGRAGAAVRGEGELADLVVELLLLAGLLCKAHRGHFWVAVGGAGNVRVVEQVRVLPRDRLCRDDALALALVCEHRRAGDVADGVDALDAGLHLFSDADEPALGELDALLLEPDVLDVGRASSRDEHDVGLELLLLARGLDRHRHGILSDLHVGDLRAGEHVDLSLLEDALDFLGAFGVLDGEDVRMNLEKGNLRAERSEDVGELAAHGARANDDDGLRRLLEHEGLVGRDDRLAIQLEADLRKAFYARAGGDDDGLLPVVLLFLSLLAFHADATLTLPFPRTLLPRDLVLLEEELDALGILGADATRAFHGDAEVELRLTHVHAEVLRLLHLLGERCRLEKGLGGNAAPEDARTAEPLALHDGGVEPQLRGAGGAHIPRGAAPQGEC